MHKRIFVLIMVLALALSGCQLAKPEADTQKEKDMLVGVFITEEHLDLFDMEAYLQDNLGALSGGILGSGACALLGLPESCMINFLLLGMTGMFAGIVRAPITGIILVAEMSGSLTQFVGLVIVSVVSALTANLLKSKPVYDELLENMLRDRGLSH